MLGEKYGNDLKYIPISSDTVSRHVTTLLEDIKSQFLDKLRQSPSFTMQLDESTDVLNLAQLLVYVLYCYDGYISEESLEGRMTRVEIFGLIDKLLKMNGLLWSNSTALCSDGAVALTVVMKGFTTRVKVVAPQ